MLNNTTSVSCNFFQRKGHLVDILNLLNWFFVTRFKLLLKEFQVHIL